MSSAVWLRALSLSVDRLRRAVAPQGHRGSRSTTWAGKSPRQAEEATQRLRSGLGTIA